MTKKRNASSRIRTDDLVITSDAPYQLGHQGLFLKMNIATSSEIRWEN